MAAHSGSQSRVDPQLKRSPAARWLGDLLAHFLGTRPDHSLDGGHPRDSPASASEQLSLFCLMGLNLLLKA
jgi:hypothetical protein